ncbi:hypothetical protein KAR91_25520 [Candidatus Pacearchaeota archaeon]|nr:hypothetical protein [Candidatus Pacearchaeota archaeon]
MKNYQVSLSNGESYALPVDGRGINRETLAASATLTGDQVGRVLLVATDALTFTLPATKLGMVYIIQNAGADAAVGITISPNASDKIMGSFATGGANIVMSGTDDKDLVNTKATALKGDFIVLEADGADGWYIRGGIGIWTEESQVASGVLEPYELVTDDRVITQADSGKVFGIATDAKTFTLPSTVAGMKLTFINTGADGNNIITISPAAADGIFGTITLAATVVQMAGTADTDVINTKASALKGDSMTLIGDGVDGWAIVASTGIWASE